MHALSSRSLFLLLSAGLLFASGPASARGGGHAFAAPHAVMGAHAAAQSIMPEHTFTSPLSIRAQPGAGQGGVGMTTTPSSGNAMGHHHGRPPSGGNTGSSAASDSTAAVIQQSTPTTTSSAPPVTASTARVSSMRVGVGFDANGDDGWLYSGHKVGESRHDDRSGHQVDSLGLFVAPATDVEGAGERGLAIIGVDPNGKAAELGFQQGDIILKAGNTTVSRPEDLAAAISAAKAAGRKNTLVMVKRDKASLYVALPAAVS